MSALSRCPRCGTELHRASETVWFVMFVCPHCHAICIFPPQDAVREKRLDLDAGEEYHEHLLEDEDLEEEEAEG